MVAMATNAQVKQKAGANANSTATGSTYTSEFVAQADSVINCVTRFNWSDKYSSLNVDVKNILTEASSNLAAIYCICYDMSGFSSRTEAENMINILRDGFLRAISILRDQKVKQFMEDA